jgi:hypothetical protein
VSIGPGDRWPVPSAIGSASAEVTPSVRLQILATEHWSLLATRGQTWAEVMGRITAQFTFVSASLVALALASQVVGLGRTFQGLALWLGVSVLLTGTLTTLRVSDASAEDLRLVQGMNRLRSAYVAIDPAVESVLVTGAHHDGGAFERTYSLGVTRSWRRRLLASAFMFSVSVNTVVAAGLGALLGATVHPEGPVAVLTGLVTASAYVALVAIPVQRHYATVRRSVAAPA